MSANKSRAYAGGQNPEAVAKEQAGKRRKNCKSCARDTACYLQVIGRTPGLDNCASWKGKSAKAKTLKAEFRRAWGVE